VPSGTQRAYCALERFLAQRTDIVHVLNSNELSEGQSKLRASVRYVRIPNGVDLARFPPSPPLADPPSEKIVLLCVGRLSRQKGQDLLISAVGGLPPALKQRVSVRLAGSGTEDRLRSLAHSKSVRVEFLGHVDSVAELYAAADLVVMPSRWEGQPLSILEAIAAGAAILATPAAVDEDTRDAVAVAHPTERDLTETLTELLEHPARLRPLRAASWAIRTQFALTRTTSRHIELVSGLYSNPKGP
jgi:glycosyltransferase involved in cell wall biosynthesis